MPEFKLEDGLICYNWMPLVADLCIDYPPEFYTNWGVESLHDKELPQIEDFENMEDNSIVFAKTDFIINGEFQETFLPHIKKPFKLVTAV